MENTLVIDVEVYKFLHNLGFGIVALLTCIFVALLVLIFAVAWRN